MQGEFIMNVIRKALEENKKEFVLKQSVFDSYVKAYNTHLRAEK